MPVAEEGAEDGWASSLCEAGHLPSRWDSSAGHSRKRRAARPGGLGCRVRHLPGEGCSLPRGGTLCPCAEEVGGELANTARGRVLMPSTPEEPEA